VHVIPKFSFHIKPDNILVVINTILVTLCQQWVLYSLPVVKYYSFNCNIIHKVAIYLYHVLL